MKLQPRDHSVLRSVQKLIGNIPSPLSLCASSRTPSLLDFQPRSQNTQSNSFPRHSLAVSQFKQLKHKHSQIKSRKDTFLRKTEKKINVKEANLLLANFSTGSIGIRSLNTTNIYRKEERKYKGKLTKPTQWQQSHQLQHQRPNQELLLQGNKKR